MPPAALTGKILTSNKQIVFADDSDVDHRDRRAKNLVSNFQDYCSAEAASDHPAAVGIVQAGRHFRVTDATLKQNPYAKDWTDFVATLQETDASGNKIGTPGRTIHCGIYTHERPADGIAIQKLLQKSFNIDKPLIAPDAYSPEVLSERSKH